MAQILVVEDEESLLQTLRYNLSRAGHEVRLSTNGLQALDMIRGNPPELVVLDLMLPGLDGLELCRAVRAETANPAVAHVPILMLTARDEEIDKVVGLEVGADDYLTKPFSMHELLARVKAQLRRADMGAAVKDAPLQLASGDLLRSTSARTGCSAAPSRCCSNGASSICWCISCATPASCRRARRCCATSGATSTSATPAPSTSTCAGCAARSSPIPTLPRRIQTVRGIGYVFQE